MIKNHAKHFGRIFTGLFLLGGVSCSLATDPKNLGVKVGSTNHDSTRLEANLTANGAATAESQTISAAGKYVFKTYRKGKGGFDNSVEITDKGKGKIHIVFSGNYSYMAGGEETFHEGSGEGDGQLKGNIATASLDGDDGPCNLTLTFAVGQVAVKSQTGCSLNVVPEGIYKKQVSVAVKPTGYEICPDPSAKCLSPSREFAEWELPYQLPKLLKRDVNYKSVPFYAVLIKTYESEECDEGWYTASIERERVRIQKLYPARKVFGSHNCPDSDAIGYDFPGQEDADHKLLFDAFIAVYAGKTPEEAREFLMDVQTHYPKAELKQMTASYSKIDQ